MDRLTFQWGVNRPVERTAFISLSNPGSTTQHSALSGGTGGFWCYFGSITFHKDSIQVNGGPTIPYVSVVVNSAPMNRKGDQNINTNPKAGTTVPRPNKTLLNKTTLKPASQPAKLSQPLGPRVVISLSNPGKDTKYPMMALVNSGITGNLIKPSAAPEFGPWSESKVPIASIVGPGANISVHGLVFLDLRIGDSVLHGQRFFVADFEFRSNVMLGRESGVTFQGNCVKVNGETIRYASGVQGNGVIFKSIRSDESEALNEEDKA